MKIVQWFFGSLLGVIALLLSAASVPAFFYFEFFTAKHDHWIAFVAGLIFPPIALIGGALAWFGLIWPETANRPAYEAQQLMQSSTTLGAISSAANHCQWSEFSRDDIGLADKIQTAFLQKLQKDFAFNDTEIAVGRKTAQENGTGVDCSDQITRQNMRRMLNGVKAMVQ